MEILIPVGALVALAVLSQLSGYDSRPVRMRIN